METRNFYTREERDMAKETSLTALATQYGFTVMKLGKYHSLKEMDSIRIYNDRTYYRFSGVSENGRPGGSQIDFLMEFCGVSSVAEAVHTLLDFQGISNIRDMPEMRRNFSPKPTIMEEKEFILPEKADSYRRAYAYLIKTRGLSKSVVDYFVKDLKILYEDAQFHNLVFLGKDKQGAVRYATKRGTADFYKKYRGDVAGSNKEYGINIVNPSSEELRVFEANIDLMSYLDITNDYKSNKLVLGMLNDKPLVKFLEENPHIKKITFCLDNDAPALEALNGKEAVVDVDTGEVLEDRVIGYLEKYEEYDCTAELVPASSGCKDYNEYLIFLKDNGQLSMNFRNMSAGGRRM